MIRFIAVLLVIALRSGLAQWGGELRLNIHSEPRTLHPALADDDASELIRYLTGGVLVRLNRITQQLEPELAASWKVSEGGRTIRFQLRDKLQFSDGAPFTSDDVVYTMDTIVNPDLHSPVGDSFRMTTGRVRATAEGPLSVVVRFPEPLAGGPALFDQVAIMSRKSPAKEAAVLGPFYIDGRKAGAWIRLERNLNYWKSEKGKRLPYLDAIQLDIQQSRDAEFLRFRRGELHMIPALDPEQFEELFKAGGGLVRDAGPTLANEFLWFNLSPAAPLPAYKKAWFASKNFRRAVSSAIRRDDLCQVVYRGHAIPASGPFPPANKFWFNSNLTPPPFDPDSARQLLAQDGFNLSGGVLRDRENHAVEFSVITNAGNKSRERMAALIQQDLAAIGIRLNVVK
jgi:peptide/nickel transport system substrate-binding protein